MKPMKVKFPKHDGSIEKYLTDKALDQTVNGQAPNDKELQSLSVYDLIPNDKNFYAMSDLDSLASYMAVTKKVDPLDVVPIEDQPGKYKIIAGHRRHAAVLKRLEQGEIADPHVPCFVHHYEPLGSLSAADVEMANLILSNRGQRKSFKIKEKITEMQLLKPIAKKIYDDLHADGKITGNFRSYFAKEILDMSSNRLQRLTAISNLIPEAIDAIDNGELAATSGAELGALDKEQQTAYFEMVKAGTRSGTLSDIIAYKKELTGNTKEDAQEFSQDTSNESPSLEEVSAEEPDNSTSAKSETVVEPESEAEPEDDNFSDSSKDKPELEEEPVVKSEPIHKNNSVSNEPIPSISAPVPSDLTGDAAEKEADEFVVQYIRDGINRLAVMSETAKENNEDIEAALLNLRKSKLEVVLAQLLNSRRG